LIQKYGHLIRELILCVPCPFPYLWELTPAINGLSTVFLDSPEGEENLTYNSLDRQGLSHLLINNPQIRTISIQHLNFNGASKFFRQVARHCLQLQFLYVMDSFFRFEDMVLTLENNPGLQRVTFSNDGRYYIFDTPPQEEWVDPVSRLGSLAITHIKVDVSCLNSNQLETLLHSIDITHLKVIDTSASQLNEHELSSMFYFWPNVANYQLVCSSFGFRVMNALGQHFDNLRTLDVSHSLHFRNWMYEIVLSACPQLIDLGISELDMDSLFDEKREEGKVAAVVIVMQRLQIKTDNVSLYSWACTGLQGFRAARLIWPETIEKQKRAARHLLELKQLKHIQFEKVTVKPTDLEATEGDSQIFWKEGDFSRGQLEQDGETKWMVKAWPNLQTFRMRASSFGSVVSHAIDD